jgi:hypothetical protein
MFSSWTIFECSYGEKRKGNASENMIPARGKRLLRRKIFLPFGNRA